MKINSLSGMNMNVVGELWADAGLPHRPAGRDHPDELAAYAESNPDLCLAAEIDGVLAGVVIGSDDGRKGWINRLAVHPDYRNQGIAVKLIDALEKNLRARGRNIFASLIMESNDPSISLFRKAGYSTMAEKVLYFRKTDYEDA